MKIYYVYMLTNRARGTLYIGVTSNLARRLAEHAGKSSGGFTARYNLHRLVYFETTENAEIAIAREKQLKTWHRQWKINLIEQANPKWEDLGKYYGMDAEINSA